MTKQITTLNLGNNLKVNLVLENNRIKVQPTLTLFTLGDQKPFTYSLCLTTNNNISNQSFGLFASNSFDCRFSIEEPTTNVPNGCLKYEDVFGNISHFYKKTLNSNIYYSLDGKLKIEVTTENNFNIFKILDTEDNIITYKYDNSNVLQDCSFKYKKSFQYDVLNTGVNCSYLDLRYDGPKAIFNKQNNKVVGITVYRNCYYEAESNDNYDTVVFTYLNNKIKTIVFNYIDGTKSTYEFDINDSVWTLKHIESNKVLVFNFDTFRNLTSFRGDFLNSYISNYTKTVFYEGKIIRIQGADTTSVIQTDDSGNISAIYDNEGNTKFFEYEQFYNEFRVKKASNSYNFNVSKEYANILSNDFSKNNLNGWNQLPSAISATFQPISNTLPSYFSKMTNNYGTLIEASPAVSENNFETFVEGNFTNKKMSFFGIIKTNNIYSESVVYIKATPYFEDEIVGDEQILTIDLLNNGDSTIFLKDLSFDVPVDKIKIVLCVFRGSKIELYSFKLLDIPYGTIYFFDENYFIYKTLNNYSISRAKYSDGHLDKFEFKEANLMFDNYKESGSYTIKTTYLNNKTKVVEKYDSNFLLANKTIEFTGRVGDSNETLKKEIIYEYYPYLMLKKESVVNYENSIYTYLKNTNTITEHSRNIDSAESEKHKYEHSSLSYTYREFYENNQIFSSSRSFNENGTISKLNNQYYQYLFAYDTVGNLLNIKSNNTPLLDNTYVNASKSPTKLIKTEKINNTSTVIYNYNEKDNISSIQELNNGVIFGVSYNSLNQISSITNMLSGVQYHYNYDYKGNLSSFNDRNLNITNNIEDNKLISKKYTFNQEKIIAYDQKVANSQSLLRSTILADLQDRDYYVNMINDCYFPYENEDTLQNYKMMRMARNYYSQKDYLDPEEGCECSYYIDKNSPMGSMMLSTFQKARYKKVINKYSFGGTIGFVYKMKNHTHPVASILSVRVGDVYAELYCANLEETGGSSQNLMMSSYTINENGDYIYEEAIPLNQSINMDEDHFFVVNITCISGVIRIHVLTDGVSFEHYVGSIMESSSTELEYILGPISGWITYTSVDNLYAGLFFSMGENLPFSVSMDHINKVMRLFALNKLFAQDNTFSESGSLKSYYFAENNNIEQFSFKNTFKSNNGNEPISIVEKDSAFIYNAKDFTNSYYAYKNSLIYKTNLYKKGELFLKSIIFDTTNWNSYFELSSLNLRIKLMQRNQYLHIFVNETDVFSYDLSESDFLSMHSIYFSYEILDSAINFKLKHSNSSVINTQVSISSQEQLLENETFKLYIGCDSVKRVIDLQLMQGTSFDLNSFNGAFSDFIYQNLGLTSISFINNVTQYTNCILCDSFSDVFGREDKKRLVFNDIIKLNQKNEYKHKDEYISSLLIKEKIKFNTRSDNFDDILDRSFNYGYNKRNLISDYALKVNENGTSSQKEYRSQYFYDAAKRIIMDANYETSLISRNNYSYNNYGNISSINKTYIENGVQKTKNISFTYNASNPNLLTKCGSLVINYNGLYVSNIVDQSNGITKNFSYIGNKLTGITASNNISYTYYYDLQGKRIRKKDNVLNKTTEFYYDSDVLIGQEDNNNKLTFMYDSNGRLIGFIRQNKLLNTKTTYFYLRDALNNIIEVLDINMNSVVRYFYDAFGNQILTEGNEEIAKLNPFRYRGYYFDEETQLFYCNSRYYSPELCSWISPDSIEYLDPESINGLNLYCYCYNNPISYADPSGCLPQWAMWLIGGVVIAGLAIATIATGGAAGGVAGFILSGALKGAAVGAVSGALVNGTISGISSAINGGGFWSGFADGAAHGFMSGAVIGGITGAISSGLQVAKASSYWDKGTFSSGYKSMKYHYTQEVINKGLTKGNSIVKYTSDAVKFANNNGMNFTLNLSRNGLQNSWSLSRYFGNGANGLYTSSGNIITFHYFYMW